MGLMKSATFAKENNPERTHLVHQLVSVVAASIKMLRNVTVPKCHVAPPNNSIMNHAIWNGGGEAKTVHKQGGISVVL